MKRIVTECRLSAIRRARFFIACAACPLLALAATPAIAEDQEAAPDSKPAVREVDAGTKQLMAANGLFRRGLFKPASEEYQSFLSQYPQHADLTTARYALAVCRYKLADYPKAVELLGQVLQDNKFEQRDEALAVLGHCELSQNHFDKAVAAFDELLAKYSSSKHVERAMLARGQTLYLSAKYKEAAEACDGYMSRYPKGSAASDALYFLALSQRALNRNDEVVKTLSQLSRDYPNSRHQFDAALLAGQALESQNKLDAAVMQYRQMIAIAPEARKADAHFTLGAVLYRAAKYAEAAKELRSVVDDYPASKYAKPAQLQLGLVQLAAGNPAEARQTLAALSGADPSLEAQTQYGLAQCDIAEKKFESARNLLEPLLRQQPAPPNVSQIAIDRAVCLMGMNQFEQAAAEFESLPARYPNSAQIPEAMYRRAFCLHKLTKYDQSHGVCQEIAKLPKSDFSVPAAELDAENLFLATKYPEARQAYAALAESAKDASHRLKYQLRVGQSEYFAADYAKAVQTFEPLADDAKVAETESLQPAIFLLGDALLQQNKNEQAAAALKKFLAVTKADKQEAQYKLGLAQLRSKDAAAAEQTFARAAEGPADSPWVQRALFEYGQLRYKAGKGEEAASALNRVLASNAPAEVAAPASYLLGWVAYDAKQYPQAADRWKQTAEKYAAHPLAADASFQRGVALKEANEPQPALEAFEQYASAHPDGQYVVRAKQLAAQCLTLLGKKEQAAQMLASLAGQAKGAGSDSILYDLAWSQRDTKNTAAAIETYRRLLKDHPDTKLAPAARTELAELLYNDKKYDEAVSLLEAVTSDKTADAKTLAAAAYRLGWSYEKLNKPGKAAEAFSAFAGKPGDDEITASALLQGGLSYAEDGKFDKAEKSLKEMLSRFPQHKEAPVALLKLGEVQAEQNSYDASALSFSEFLEKYSSNPFAYRAHFGVGWSLENRKRYNDARQAYEKAIAATNTEIAARAQFQIGETFLEEGNFDKAIPKLLAVEDVYKYPKWSARALLEAGRAFEQLKQVEQAKQQYTQVVTKYKDAPEAEMAHDRLKTIQGS